MDAKICQLSNNNFVKCLYLYARYSAILHRKLTKRYMIFFTTCIISLNNECWCLTKFIFDKGLISHPHSHITKYLKLCNQLFIFQEDRSNADATASTLSLLIKPNVQFTIAPDNM